MNRPFTQASRSICPHKAARGPGVAFPALRGAMQRTSLSAGEQRPLCTVTRIITLKLLWNPATP